MVLDREEGLLKGKKINLSVRGGSSTLGGLILLPSFEEEAPFRTEGGDLQGAGGILLHPA